MSWCSTPAASARTPTTSSTARSGHLKSLKDRRPELEIVVAGCLAQKDRDTIAERAPHVDVVMGTHNVHRAVELLHERRRSERPVVEILEETVAEDHELFPSALPVVRQAGYAGWVTIQMGCDNSCAFCIVPAVRGPEISRPFGDVVAEVERAALEGVTEITLLGQNVNSYGRDLTLRARDGASAARRAALGPGASCSVLLQPTVIGSGSVRCSPICCGRSAPCRGSAGSATPARIPKDLRPETMTAMAEVASVCEHLHLPLQSGSDSILAAMHRGYTAERYLERLDAARRRSPTWRSPPTSSSASPARPRTMPRRRSRWPPKPASTARSPSCTHRGRAPKPQSCPTRSCPERSRLQRMERLRRVVERSSRLGNLSRVGATEEVLVIGPSRRDPSRLSGRTRQNRLVHFDPVGPVRARQLRGGRRHRCHHDPPARTHDRVARRANSSCAHPGRCGVIPSPAT